MISRVAYTSVFRFKSRFSPLVSSLQRLSSTNADQPCKPLNYIDGHRINPVSEEDESDIYVIEPSTGNIICHTQGSGKPEVDRAVASAKEAFSSWSKMSGMERGKILREAAKIIRSRVKELATLEVMDNGRIFIRQVQKSDQINSDRSPRIDVKK